MRPPSLLRSPLGRGRSRRAVLLVGLLVIATFGLTVAGTSAGAGASPVNEVRTELATATAQAPARGAIQVYALVRNGSSISVVRGRSRRDGFGDIHARLHALPGVLAVGIDAPVHAVGTVTAAQAPTNDPLYSQQWALQAVDYQDIWPTTTGTGTTVAMIDTGALATHQDLSGNVNQGAECLSATTPTESACTTPANAGDTDPNGHGTHVSGIIAAHANNSVGIAGAAPGVHILPVRALNASGAGTTEAVAAGILWATDHGANAISMSLAGSFDDPGIDSAIDAAVAHNVPVFAAAGNNGPSGGAQWPANYHNAISIGAIQDMNSQGAYTVAPFSNTTSNVALLAPGNQIESTWSSSNTSYQVDSGTSMAVPYVSAAFALLHAAKPSATRTAILNALESTAVRVAGSGGLDTPGGFGIINPIAALGVLGTSVTTTPKPTTTTRATTPTTRPKAAPPLPIVHGYWVASLNGTVRAFGVPFLGDRRGRGGAPILALGATPDGRGYWLAGADGSVFPFGDAHYYGSFAGHHLNAPIIAMAPTKDGRGYWLLGADGGIFSFGDARFYGSTGALHLVAPVVSMAATGRGYWLIARDGGVFSFGEPFFGSLPSRHIRNTIVRLRATPSGGGYWMLANDGIVYTFGNAPNRGSVVAAGAVDIAEG